MNKAIMSAVNGYLFVCWAATLGAWPVMGSRPRNGSGTAPDDTTDRSG
jgi:hypothetical protein